VTRYQPH